MIVFIGIYWKYDRNVTGEAALAAMGKRREATG
jgi:hypothetical protein